MMKKTILTTLLILTATSLYGQDITGQWNGVLNVRGTQLKLVFHIQKTDNGYTATFDSPAQGAMGIPFTSAAFDGTHLKLTDTNIRAVYTGTLKADSIVGTWKQSGRSFPLNLYRHEVKKKTYRRPQKTEKNEQASATSSGMTPAAQGTTTMFAGTSWSPRVKTILAQSKAATGGVAWNHIHTIRFKSTLKLGGISGTMTQLKDFRNGRFVKHINLGSVVIGRGYDGSVGWRKTPGGKASAQTSAVSKKRFKTSAYQTEKAWWYPERWPAKIKFVGEKQAHGKTFDVLQITPRGGNAFKLWINDKTYLIARHVDNITPSIIAVTHLSDYRTVQGVKIPFHRETFVNGEKRVTQLKHVAVNVPVSSEDFALPGEHHNDISIIGGKNKVTIPFKSVGGLIYLPVKINGQQFDFVLDSGAGAWFLSSRAAKALGLSSNGSFTSQMGAGSNTSSIGLVKAKSFVLGGKIKVVNPAFIVTGLPNFAGNQIDGLIGPGVYQHFVIRIDYPNRKVTFIKHKAFDPSHAGTPVPIKFNGGNMPLVKGSIDGLQGLFVVDTGSTESLILSSPFAKSHHLYARYHATSPVGVGSGLGGTIKVRVARGGMLKIGNVVVHNPVVNLSVATNGFFARKGIDGNIGGRILKRFTVTFDFADKRMYLKPNKNYGKPMQSHFLNRAGLRFKKTDQGFSVTNVLKSSPAAQAGIHKSDLITAVNGKSASQISFVAFWKMLRNKAPGTKVKLTIGKGKTAHKVTITLRRLIPKTGGLDR